MHHRGEKDYSPLLQDTDTDSDIDIFNARGSLQKPDSRYYGKRKPGCCNRKCYVIVAVLILFVVVIAAVLAVKYRSKKEDEVIVNAKAGRIKGFKEHLSGGTPYKFLGVPYAEPPVGDLRWKPPKPKGKLPGVYTADKSNIVCIQYLPPPMNFTRPPSEDCLYLHIHTPTLNQDAQLPVFVWFHGGYLMNGFADFSGYYPDGDFALAMDVVGVSIAYRLNAFGYLTLEELWEKNGKSYGNYGLLDQILALQWIKDNIVYFGGNPNLVTVSGQSSGGTSVFALLASPMADGLFQRAIPMSGSPNFPRNYSVAADDNKVFVKKSKCANITESLKLKDCLYKLTPSEIIESIPGFEYPFWAMDDLMFFPTHGRLDGSVLVVEPNSMPVPPKDVAKLPNMKTNVAVLVGSTGQESGFDPKYFFNSTKELYGFLGKILVEFKTVSVQDVSDIYKNVSTFLTTETDATYLYETIAADVRETCPSNVLVKDFLKSPRLSNSYRYVMAWRSDKSVKVDGMSHMHNAAHMVDAIALFGFKLWEKRPLKSAERKFMTTIREVFGMFMRTGKVLGASPGQSIVFDGKGERKVLKQDYHEEQCRMWSNETNGFLPYVWIN